MQQVQFAADPITVSVVWTGPHTADVCLRQSAPTRVSGPNVRLAIGLLLAGWGVPLGATCWTRLQSGREHAGQTDEFLQPAHQYRETNPAKVCDKLLKESLV